MIYLNHERKSKEGEAMTVTKRIGTAIILLIMCLFLCVGYAAVADTLLISGSVEVAPQLPDVYITNEARQIVKPSATLFSNIHLAREIRGIYEDDC